MVCLGRPYHFKFFKYCLPQILLGLFLNALTHILIIDYTVSEVESAVLHDGKMSQLNTLPHFKTPFFHANYVCFTDILSN